MTARQFRNLNAEQKRRHHEAILEGKRFNLYAAPRRRMEDLWTRIMAKPIKFPSPRRRRRGDREIPKAA